MPEPWTPGPWTARRSVHHTWVKGVDHPRPYWLVEPVVTWTGAWGLDEADPPEYGLSEADACLIAAAPEMAQLLDALYFGWAHDQFEVTASEAEDIMEQVGDLLARIRGEGDA